MIYRKAKLFSLAALSILGCALSRGEEKLSLPVEEPYKPLNWELKNTGKPQWHLASVPKDWKNVSLDGEWNFKEVPFVREKDGNPSCQGMTNSFFNAGTDQSDWRKVTVPSSWYLKKFNDGKTEFVKGKIGWYKRSFNVDAKDLKEFKNLVLDFRRVSNNCDVWVNGQKVGEQHVGRFSSFQHNITSYVKEGENQLTVRVYEYTGHTTYHRRWIGGIYHPVRLLYSTSSLSGNRMMVTSNLADSSISVKAEINNPSSESVTKAISYEVVNWKDGKVNTTGKLDPVEIKAGTNWAELGSINLDNPTYWDNDNPHLYLVRLLDENGASIGVHRFGFRDFKAKGEWLYLNGKKFKLRGFTMSSWRREHELMNVDNIHLRNLEFYKEIGINIIRPHAQDGMLPETFFNICDEIGIPVYVDWCGPDYAHSFDKPWKSTTIEMWPSFKKFIKDNYSHPSIVMWSFNNEMYENHFGQIFSYDLDKQYGWVKELDKQGRPICTSTGRQTYEAITSGVLKERVDVLDDHQYRGAYSGSWQDNIQHIDRYAEAALKRYKKPMPKINCEYGTPGDNMRYRPVTFNKLYPAFEMDPTDPEFKRQYISFMQSPSAVIGTYLRLKMNYCSPRIYVTEEAECRRLYAQKRFKRFVEIYRRAEEKCIGGHTNAQGYDLVNILENWGSTSSYHGKPGPMPQNNKEELIMPLAFEVKRLYNPTLVTAGVFNQHPIAGSKQEVDIYVTNDLNESGEFKVVPQLNFGDDEIVKLDEVNFGKLAEMEQKKVVLSYNVPEFSSTKRGKLELYLFKNGERVGDNYYFISIPQQKLDVDKEVKVALYDNYGRLFRGVDGTVTTTEVLKKFDYDFEPIADFSNIDEYKYLIIGANSFDKDLISSSDVIFEWVKKGGKLLCFEQSLCGKIPFYPNNSIVAGSPSTYVSLTVYNHPMFKGLEQEDFDTWANDRGTLFDYAIGPLNEGLVAVSPTGSWKDTDEIKAVISDVKLGEGAIIFSQLTATKRYNVDAVAKSYLKNTLNYFSEAGVSKFATRLQEQEFSKVTYLDDKDAHYIDLSKAVNQAFKDEVAGDKKGGWSDFGGSSDFEEIPVGTSRLQGAVPFKVIDPAKNNGKSCIVLKGKERPYFPEKVTDIPVDAVLNNIYVLHTSMYTKDGPVVKYVIHYEDGKSHEFVATGKREIPDWWHPKNRSNAVVVFQKNSRGLYLSDFVNPRPKVKIKSMDIISVGDSIPIVVSITGRKRFTSVISGVGEK